MDNARSKPPTSRRSAHSKTDDLTLSPNSTDLADQESASLPGITAIAKVGKKYCTSEITVTDGITSKYAATENLDLVLGKIGDAPAVGSVLGIAKSHDTGNLILHSGTQILDSAVIHSGTLPMSVLALL
jgi:hypothetical protein